MEKSTRATLRRAHGLMLLATVLVATSFPVGAAITHGMDAVVLTLLRFALAALLFWPIVVWRYGLPLPGWRDLLRYAVISAFLVGFFWGMFAALRHTSALNTGTIFTLTPAIAAGVSYLLLRERLGRAAQLALPVGLLGAVWVIFRGDLDALLALELGKGDAIFLAATISMGCYMPLVKFLHRGEPMARMTFWTLVTGTGWLLLLSLSRLGSVDWMLVPMSVYGGIAYLAVFTTLITFFIFQASTTLIGPTRVLSYTYLNPVFVLAIGLGFGETLPPLATYPGLVLIVGATIILQRSRAV
jgi:drug/metabolite transporter (DMT)-like permease